MPDERAQPIPRRYANWLEVGFSAEEFVLDFGQRFDERTPAPHCGIVTTPRAAHDFLDVLTRSIAEHAQRYGPPAREATP
jgi:hypothetical protein